MTVEHRSKLRTAKVCTHVLDSLVRSTKECRTVGTSTRADACTCASDRELSFCRRRFQTGETPEKHCTHVSTPWSGCLETLLRNWYSCLSHWSAFRNSNDGRIRKNNCFLSVTALDPGTGGQDVEDVETRAWARHTRQPTRETTERDAEM